MYTRYIYKDTGDVDQYGVYLPLVFDTVDPSEKEQEKKQGIEGEEGSQTIFYSIHSLNKNIVSLERNK